MKLGNLLPARLRFDLISQPTTWLPTPCSPPRRTAHAFCEDCKRQVCGIKRSRHHATEPNGGWRVLKPSGRALAKSWWRLNDDPENPCGSVRDFVERNDRRICSKHAELWAERPGE